MSHIPELAPMLWGVTGLNFGLLLYALFLIGYDSKPTAEGQPPIIRALGGTGGISAAIALTTAAWMYFTTDPFHDTFASPFVGTTLAIYGFLWIGITIVSWFGLDLRWVGNMALVTFIVQVVNLPIFLIKFGTAPLIISIFIGLVAFLPLLAGLWAATHGKLSLKSEGYIILGVFVITVVFLLYIPLLL